MTVPRRKRPHTRPSERAPAEPFEHVAALEPHGPDAKDKLQQAYDRLLRLGAHGDAERLRAADQAAERGERSAIERLATADHPLTALAEIQHARTRRVVILRNTAVLLPLVLTWFFLGWASLYYRDQLAKSPELSTQPFLVLWQQHFGGRLIPTFAQVAGLSCGLLLVVLVLTVWAHWRESRASREFAAVAGQVDDAMMALALAAETSAIRPPISAAEWAGAAQRVLADTQQLITNAVRDVKELARTNNQIAATAQQAMEALQTQSQEFVAGLARETGQVLEAVRVDNAQVVARTAEEAKQVLQQAGAANKQLIEQQMTPLFKGFQASLAEYRADQQTYHASASALARAVTELTASAAVLTASSESSTKIAGSIDEHLRVVGASQREFVTRVTESSQSVSTAASAISAVAGLMTGQMRSDIEALARNVVDASASLATIDRNLGATVSALQTTTRAMQATAAGLAGAGYVRRRWWPFTWFTRTGR
jgi:hypothetical protein